MDKDDELENRLATLNAFAEADKKEIDKQLKEKEKLLKESAEAVQLLKSFVLRTCNENNKKPPEINDGLNVNQMSSLAISIFQVILAETSQKTHGLDQLSSKIEELQKQCDQLLEENRKLRLQVTASTAPKEQEPAKIQHTPAQSVENISTSTLVTKTDQPVQKTQTQKSANPLLELVCQSKLMRLDDLIDHCSTKLSLTVKEARDQIENLEKEGLLEVFNSPMKPIQGHTYPALFSLTRSGMNEAGTKQLTEMDRLLSKKPELTQREIPVLVFAVQEYLPRHGYEFVSYAPDLEYIDDSNKRRVFTPHAQLRNDKGKTIYVMYEGEGYQDGANVRKYFKDYSVMSDGNAYFLALNRRVFTELSGRVNALNFPNKIFKSLNYTNITDWPTYDKMIRESDPNRPKTVWFGRLYENKG